MKPQTGASLIPVWHCDFIPSLHDRKTSWRPTWLWRHIGLDVEDYTCATRSRLPGEWFYAEENSRTLFTWHRNGFSHRNESLAPVEWPGCTCTSMTCSFEILCWYYVNEYRATRENRTGFQVGYRLKTKIEPGDGGGGGGGGRGEEQNWIAANLFGYQPFTS